MRFSIKFWVLFLVVTAVSHAEPRVSNPFAGLENDVALVEQATASVLRRMTFPVTNSGDDTPRPERLFSTLPQHVAATSGEAELLVGAGPAGDALAFIQDQLWKAMEKDANVDRRAVLARIAADTHDIPALDVIGVGSDLDFLLKAPSTHFNQLQTYIASRTSGTAQVFSPQRYETPVEDVVFPKDDVKGFNNQLSMSTKQGGASVDHMSFSLTTGHFVDPPGNRVQGSLIEEFLRGRLHHFAPNGESERFDSSKQAARTIRVMTKFPWMTISDETVLRRDLAELLDDVRRGVAPNERVVKQLLKIVRNGRASNGDNRFHESLRESRGRKDKPIEAVALEVVQAVEARFGTSYMPRVAADRPIGGEAPALERLISPERFVLDFTLGSGWMYYAVPSPEHALGVLRGNFVVSGNAQRGAQGVHLTGDLQEAQKLAGEHGMIVRVQMNRAQMSNLRIVDWQNLKDRPDVVQIVRTARRAGKHPFEEVAWALKLDAIVDDGHVWVQNARAMEPVRSLGEIIEGYGRVVDNPHADPKARLTAALSYEQLYQYAVSSGQQATAPRTRQLVDELMNSANRGHHEALLDALPEFAEAGLRFEHPELRNYLLSLLVQKDGPPWFRVRAIESTLALPLGAEGLRPFVLVAAQDASDHVRDATLRTIARFSLYHPEIPLDPLLRVIVMETAAEDAMPRIRELAWGVMAHLRLSDEELHTFVVREVSKGGKQMQHALEGLQAYATERQKPLPESLLPILMQAAMGAENYARRSESLFSNKDSERLFAGIFGDMSRGAREAAFGALALVDVSPERMLDTMRSFSQDQKGRRMALQTLTRYAESRGEKLTGEARAFIESIDLDTDLQTRMAAYHAAHQTDMTPAELKAFQQKVFFDPEFVKPTIDWEQVRQGGQAQIKASLERSMNYRRQLSELSKKVSGDGRASEMDPMLREVLQKLFTSTDKKTRKQALENYGYLFFDWDLLDEEHTDPRRFSSRMLQAILPVAAKAAPEVQLDIFEYLHKMADAHPEEGGRGFKWLSSDSEDQIYSAARAALKSKNDRLKIAAAKFIFHTARIGVDGRLELLLELLRSESPLVREEAVKMSSWFEEKLPELVEALTVATKDAHSPVRKAATVALQAVSRLPEPEPESEYDRLYAEEMRLHDAAIGGVMVDMLEMMRRFEAEMKISPDERGTMLSHFITKKLGNSMTPELQQEIARLLADPATPPDAIRQLVTALRNANHHDTDLATTRVLVQSLKRPEVRRVLTENEQIPFNKALAECLAGMKAMGKAAKEH